MRFSDFKTLDLPWQAKVVCEDGSFLSFRTDDQYFIELYQVDSFYVEIYYRLIDNEIEKFLSFHDINLLEPYLNKIEVALFQ
jgi:hypothetical protein